MAAVSAFRVEKRRVEATITLSTGESILGSFFVAGGSARHKGPERVGDLLNGDVGFVPFERLEAAGESRTVLYNRTHLAIVALAVPEARTDPGYEVAKRRQVWIRLSNGRHLLGSVRVYRPEGRDRVSDWARAGEQFRYIETDEATLLVNTQHIVEVSEAVEES